LIEEEIKIDLKKLTDKEKIEYFKNNFEDLFIDYKNQEQK
jgi:hypothetical protein